MKQRIISALLGVLLLVIILFASNTVIFNAAIGLLAAIAVFEVLHCIQVNVAGIYILCMAYAACIPFAGSLVSFMPALVSGILLSVFVLLIMLKNFEKLRYEKAAAALATTFLVTFSFTSLVYLKDLYSLFPDEFPKEGGMFLLLTVLLCAWATDTGAYFVGVFFGKHKLVPKISPKKTVEGAVGGVAVCIIANLILSFVFNNYIFKDYQINYFFIGLVSALLSVVGMLGDLNASVIKRNYNVKDFGKIMPGHGGVMDRFDSVSFVAPCLYAMMVCALSL